MLVVSLSEPYDNCLLLTHSSFGIWHLSFVALWNNFFSLMCAKSCLGDDVCLSSECKLSCNLSFEFPEAIHCGLSCGQEFITAAECYFINHSDAQKLAGSVDDAVCEEE